MSALRLSFLFIALAAIVAAVSYRWSVFQTPPPPPTPDVLFITGGSGPYWQITASGARTAARDHDVALQVEMPTEDENIEQQMGLLSSVDFGKYDGVAISPLDADNQTRLLNLIAQNAHVVTFDSDAPLSQRECYVGTSNYGAGQLAAKLVREAIPEGGKVAVLLANLTKSNMQERKSGFEESVAQSAGATESDGVPEYEVVDYLIDDGDDEVTAKLIHETLSEHPDLACLVGMNAQHGPVMLKVLEAEGKLGQIKIVAFDEEKETLDGIEAGHIYATVAQDPYKYGYEAVRILSNLCKGDEKELPIVGSGSLFVNAEGIRKDKLAEFRKRLLARLEAAQNGKGGGTE